MKRFISILFILSFIVIAPSCSMQHWASSNSIGKATKRTQPVKGNIRTRYKPRKGTPSINNM